MRMKLLLTSILLASVAVAADAPSPITDAQKLAAEKARREFFQLQSQLTQLQAQLTQKATEANGLLVAIQTACVGSDPAKVTNIFEAETLACTPKPPAPPPAGPVAPTAEVKK